ncbi:MAG TPA: ArsR family transcriptional regulator [Candidatus Caldiarchaeum subterraneum]|uniref:ArsR family transcriptional regulator n=1 Tax=Caldiarchaeum subterraneum TaxID=311458 RepID=A0A832ZUN3_CALS0|nr:ArsR family transcriptional regulator [Candidatus Caldarchaeum subterraneum]
MAEIPLSPVGREQVHKLETALLIGSILRPDVIDMLRNPEERLTWVDSLAVAASALAREKAKMTISQIADDLGRTEATVRHHLQGKTKAGQVVRETYEKFLKEGVNIILPSEIFSERITTLEEAVKHSEEINKLRDELKETKKKLEETNTRISQITDAVAKSVEKLSEVVEALKKTLS